MNLKKISNLTDYLILDEIFGTADDEPELSLAEQRKLEAEQRKIEELYSDDQALANLAVLRTDGVIQRIFITQKEAEMIVRLMCLMAVYGEED